MPELAPVGVDREKIDPVTIPIVGRDSKSNPVTVKIRFWGKSPVGTNQDMIDAIRPDGQINVGPARVYIDECVLPDDREKWDELIHGSKVLVEQATLLEVYTSLVNFYVEGLPTKPRPVSRTGRGSTEKTSKAVASVKKSISKR